MKTIEFWCLLFGCLTFASAYEHERIIRGNTAQPGQFPYIVSLRHPQSNQHFCGGSILSDVWIVTAARCTTYVNSQLDKIIAVVGAHYVNDGVEHRINKIINHPHFSARVLTNDIALIHTANKIEFVDKLIQPIELPTVDIVAGGRVQVAIPGWGYSKVRLKHKSQDGHNDRFFCINSIRQMKMKDYPMFCNIKYLSDFMQWLVVDNYHMSNLQC